MTAALEVLMKMWDHRQGGRILDQDTEGKRLGSKQDVLRAAMPTAGRPAASGRRRGAPLRGFQRL